MITHKEIMMKNRTRNEIITAILRIKMEVPSDWLYKEINNLAVTFVMEKTLPSAHKAVVVVSVENVQKDMCLDVFTQGNMKDMRQNTSSFHLITFIFRWC